VIAHYKGLCHTYVHDDANLEEAIDICLNAKVQRPGVCNAMETLLVHQKIAKDFLAKLIPLYLNEHIEIRGCDKSFKINKNIKKAKKIDWDTEHLDKILNLKIVKNLDEAIVHINEHGTLHTEAILTQDQNVANVFRDNVMASCIVHNASTRFNDGGELGLGAELGISTTKLHAFGPMGIREMTTSRFLVEGNGHIRK
jgi:glutamate-5-semialdehyde dehydrogenase